MSDVTRIPHTVKPGNLPGEYSEEHESYGMVSLVRTHGGVPKLFGSYVERHDGDIRLTVSTAVRSHSLSRDWYRSRRQLIEVRMSSAQFAELITTMNMGDGTPCTITRVLGTKMDDVPDVGSESERVRVGFQDSLDDLVTFLKDGAKTVGEILDKKSITQADKASIRGVLDRVITKVSADMPFVLTSFVESTEKVVTHAKAEVDAFMTSVITHAGIKSLRSVNTESDDPKSLEQEIR